MATACSDGRQLRRCSIKNFEDEIYPRARAAAKRLDSVAQGEERAIRHVDPINGHKSVTFLRRDCFTNDFTRRGRRVASFWSEHGPMDASGRLLR